MKYFPNAGGLALLASAIVAITVIVLIVGLVT